MKLVLSLLLLILYTSPVHASSCTNKKLAKKYTVTYNEVDYGLFTFTLTIIGKSNQNTYRYKLFDQKNGLFYDGELVTQCGNLYFQLPLLVGVDFYTPNAFGIDQYVGTETQRADVDCSGRLNKSGKALGNCSASLIEPNTGAPFNYSGFLELHPSR